MNSINIVKTIICALVFLTFSFQTKANPNNELEFRVGAEVNRSAPFVGFSKNFYLSETVSIAPELFVLGSPVLGGTFRLSFPVTKQIRISPHAGFGITPVGLPVSTVGVLGINFSYKLNHSIHLFVEPRIIYFPHDIISICKEFWQIDELNNKKPIVISVGISFWHYSVHLSQVKVYRIL